MKDESEREVPNPHGSAAVADRFAKVLPSRRRLITGGLAAAPILASLTSKALAADCTTPSGALSGNVSTGAAVGTCNGLSPSFWAGLMPSGWPGGSGTANAKFHSIFLSGPSANFGSASMKTVAGWSISQPDPSMAQAEQLGAYFVAAYANVLDGVISIPGFDQTGLVNLLTGIWGDYALHGMYQVTPTVSWTASQIKTYLTSNGFAAP